ncbi:cysteine desulfurase-like protein [Roseinatronobacter alkalisoli]|uniref:Cysteine desulfurase-like protein n=1 Tax=Roseinatronobacter alkalisoli TaxID=3028235 RepID=A0ABT5T682_9RHOB|nr:cysteine desulfurase-like protein [Roseinatronobacter sp. HJB301]MDD7970616.1 cysteine desulfurase-like protein [Roseinatronobacter sp. HJB301]
MPSINMEFVRNCFPGLKNGTVFLDNAGGSQVAQQSIDHIVGFLSGESVQLGASYAASQKAGAAVADGRAALATLMNAARPEEVVMGATATQLLDQLARALVQGWKEGDEVIVTNFDHEANIGPWRQLEARGINIREWKMPAGSDLPDMDDLRALLSDRTRMVALTHTSNIFGTIMPIREIADIVHDAGAKICVDGVAYAPHRAIDVQALDVDYYVFSVYKVYGPHHAALYGRYDLLRHDARNINHYFYGEDKVPNKLEPGNPNYELAAGCRGVVEYLEKFAGAHGVNTTARAAVEAAFDVMADHEAVLAERLLSYLRARADITILGQEGAGRAVRVPTISFIVNGNSSAALVRKVDPSGIGIRFGDFHSKRLVESMNLSSGDGVIRASAVHYNTVEEIDRLIDQLERQR